ncbi:uncharacterized protein LOC116939932 isoform X1 [Petromyzon marinus]|uniref:uncharacterized protein LOC116939932 isoform X1 n=1 Tax=Petromyzon marinus TaxID=7757 RepID=UPI003F70F20F
MMSEVRVSPSGSGGSSSSNGGSPGEEEAAAAALRGSRRSPVLPRTAVCRSLFGSPEHGEVEKELKETLAALAEDHRRRWNFDFEGDRPLRGRFEWEALDGATVPGCYRTRPLSNNNNSNNNNSSSRNPNLGLVSNGNPGLLTPALAATRADRPQSHGDDGNQSITATVTTTTAAATTTTTPTANNSTNNNNNNRKNTDSSSGDRGDAFSTKSVLRDESPRRGEEDEHGRQPGRGGPSAGGDGATGPGGGSSGGDGSAGTSPAGGEASSSSADVEMIPRDRSASACHDRTRQTSDAYSHHKRGSALMGPRLPLPKRGALRTWMTITSASTLRATIQDMKDNFEHWTDGNLTWGRHR